MDTSIQGQLTQLFFDNAKMQTEIAAIQSNLLMDGGRNEEGLKVRYSHRDFILRIGQHYAAIERLKDTNASLPPDQKNYELSRLFTLWDKAEVIDLGDEDLRSAFDAFVSLGLMTSSDALAILTPNEVA